MAGFRACGCGRRAVSALDDAAENPDGIPTACAKCHSTAGYQDFLGADGSEAGKVDANVPAASAQGVQCVACHNAATISKTTVVFPSGAEIAAGITLVVSNVIKGASRR